MNRQWTIVGVVVVLLTAGAVLGSHLGERIAAVEVGGPAPDFRAVDLASGDTVSVADLRGSVALINIWATWCEPCRVEMPSIQRLFQELGPRGLRVLAVSIDEAGPDVVRQFQREFGLTFEILHDRTRAIERQYQTTGVPETFIIDREGRIVKRSIGYHDWASPTNRALIERLLARRG